MQVADTVRILNVMHQFFSSIRLWLKATAYEIKREVQERVEIFLIPPCIIRNYSSLFSWGI